VLITTYEGNKVVRRCITDVCASSRNKVMVKSNAADLREIVSISSLGEYLVPDNAARVVYRCSLTGPTNQILENTCEVFTIVQLICMIRILLP